MNIQQANDITGGLSRPSKMPGRAFNISAFRCNVGSKLAKIEGSTCSHCYARKGRYGFPNVQSAMEKRFLAFGDDFFITAMVTLIRKQSPDYFRWFDSGDLQSIDMLEKIILIACATPNTKHWLPTREVGLLAKFVKEFPNRIPENLVIRVSATFIDAPKEFFCFMDEPQIQCSMVHKDTIPDAFICPARKQGNKCGDCRACWDPNIETVSYEAH